MPISFNSIDIKKYHPVQSAHYLAGLLIDRRYQSNLRRIYTLLEYAVANFKGKEMPTIQDFHIWLNEWEPILDIKIKWEDPCEDVYVSRAVTRWGDFRIYNGQWEGNEFYLRMVLEAVGNLPSKMEYMLSPIKAILWLSDSIAERTKAELGAIGLPNDHAEILLDATSDHTADLVFTVNDLAKHKLTFEDFYHFIFDNRNPSRLNDQQFGNTDLERHPLILHDGKLVVLRPTEISIAIRRYAIEQLSAEENKTIFENRIARVHWDALRRLNIINGHIFRDAPLNSVFDSGVCWIEVALSWGNGRYLHVVVMIDTLFEFTKTGFVALHSEQKNINERLNKRLTNFKTQVTGDPAFRQGLSVVVWSGYGRPVKLGKMDFENGWDTLTVPFYDLDTIQWVPDFPRSTFWKLSNQLSILKSRNIEVLNLSGILNLYGWWLECGKMLIPHHYESHHKHTQVSLPTDCIAEVRKMSLATCDFRSLKYVDGTFIRIGRKNATISSSPEPQDSLYAAFDHLSDKKLLGCALPSYRPWWILMEVGEAVADLGLAFKLWDLTFNWMDRISKILEEQFPQNDLPFIRYIIDVNEVLFDSSLAGIQPKEQVVRVEVSQSDLSARIILSKEFISAVYSPINTAERAIVSKCIEGFMLLSGMQDQKEIERLCNRVVPSDAARYFHVFTSSDFSETLFLKNYPFEIIDPLDSSFIKLGLADLSGVKGKRSLQGKDDCKQFLSAIVMKLYDHVVDALATYNREHIIILLFQNICGIEHDRATWKRTSGAVMGLGKGLDKFAIDRRSHFEDLLAADHSSRVLIEIATSASQVEGGIIADKHDLSPLMAKMSMIYYLGNLSDGIDKGIIEPVLEVVGNGEIWQSHEFQENVMAPMTTDLEKESALEDASTYLNLFKRKDTSEGFPAAFTEAFAQEFGVSIDEMLKLVYALDALCKERDIIKIRWGALKELLKPKLEVELLERILASFSLLPRLNHNNPPEGFKKRDVHPWLFRRRLSLLFKPIVRLDNEVDPTYIIVPDFFFKSLLYLTNLFFTSDMSPDWCRSKLMKSWIGENARQMGRKFNKRLAQELRTLGYEVVEEVNVTQLLPPAVLKEDYGDVDVVAWKKGTASLYMIECKDLVYAKTFREIAEQIVSYRGELKEGKPDNLRKHVNRLAVLTEHKANIQMKFPGLLPAFTLHGYVVFSKRVPVLYDTTYQGSIKFSFYEEVKNNGLSSESVFSDVK